MTKKKLTDPSKIPFHRSEEDEVRFWQSHELTEAYLDKAEAPPEDALPPRSKPISVRLGEDIVARLKVLAEQKRKGYQTLLKEFVIERLREEEIGALPKRVATFLRSYQKQNKQLQEQLAKYESLLKAQGELLQVQAEQLYHLSYYGVRAQVGEPSERESWRTWHTPDSPFMLFVHPPGSSGHQVVNPEIIEQQKLDAGKLLLHQSQ